MKSSILIALISLLAAIAGAQVTTQGFLNLPRTEAPGTLLSHPVANGSEPIGRTTSVNYVNGWIIVGAESPGSRPGSDLQMRVYDISNPANPVRRFPSDFNLSYPNNSWFQGNYGWGAHGTAQSGNMLLPDVIRVNGFGAAIESGGTNGIPNLAQMPLGYSRANMSGPWDASFPWYGSPDADFYLRYVTLNANGYASFRPLATFDHVGKYGGGDWHPMIFGDLLIYARSGGAARDGVVVYRLEYHNFDDPANRTVTPHYVGSLSGGFQGYWPNLFSDGTGLFVIGSSTNILNAANITEAASPSGSGEINVAASLTIPGFTNASYPVYQDQFGFIHNRKIDMTRFLAGDANPIVLTLDEAGTGVNTSQMSLALGNLWLTGGYPIPGTSQGMGVWVHQQAPDTTPPRVSYHIPQANRTNYPRHAPLSFLLHEHPRHGGPRNGIDFTVRPVLPGDTLGSAVSGFLIHDFAGNLTFSPNSGLAADTTYQVDFLSDPANQIGFCDAAGNYIEPYSFRFSTGGGIDATTPPSFTSLTADIYQPAPGATVTVTATASGTAPLEYRFNFNGSWTAWSSNNFASHSYAIAGRPRVLAQVRDSDGNIVTDSLRLLVIQAPAAGPRPTRSSTLAVGDDPLGRRLWSVNPDAHSVAVLDAASGDKIAEHPVGQNPRNIARDANGRYWVTCHGSDEIRILNPDGSLHSTISLAYGAAPFGIAASPDGQSLFVTLHGSGHLHRYQAANPNAAPAVRATFPTPRAIAISADGQRVLVTRFISPEMEAEIGEFAGNSPSLDLTRTFRLSSANTIDGGDRAAGVPNYLAGIAISPDGTRAAIASKQDNIQRGTFFGTGNLTHETTVRAVVSFLDLTSNTEIRHSRRDFDNSESPSALTYTPLGDTLLVALQGNNQISGIDALNLAPLVEIDTPGSTSTSPAVVTLELSTGLAPQGLLIDSASGRLFSQDFMGRSITVRNAAPLLTENRSTLPLIATTSTVATEPLAANVLLGKQIFYNAADPRMSADSYISCASCHVDGGHDGRVWDFTGRGEGLRRTTDLRGRSGMGHGAVHWSGNFDEIQDFEHDIRGPFGGTGFLNLTPQQFATRHPSPASGKSGLSADLDALAAYVTSLDPSHTPRSPARQSNGALTAAALRGQTVFQTQNCNSCHSGPALTNSALSQVGTLSTLSGQRLGSVLTGIDTPTLHGLHATRTYLHHGQAETLADVFAYTGGTLFPAASAQFLTTINPNAVGPFLDDPNQGGGGYYRGPFGGSSAFIGEENGAATPPGLRFLNVDGGPAGGPARLTLRYIRQYNNGTALLRINGVQQTLNVLRQYPDNSWQTSGWRSISVETTLNPGPVNTIEVLRGNGDLILNTLLVSNSADLTQAQPHRLVQSLPSGDRDDLLAYLRQLDGRDVTGTPIPSPAPPAAQPPGIVSSPGDITLATGNSLSLTVAVSGSGPFQFQWHRGTSPVGTNSPTLEIPAAQPTDSGSYTVTITNAVSQITTPPAQVTVNPALAITTSTLPVAKQGRVYQTTLSAIGGISDRTWDLVAGVLPPGLTFSAAGQLSGTPTAPAIAQLSFRVTDSSGSATRDLNLSVPQIGGFVADPDLVLHYSFDEAAGTRIWDAAPAGNNHATDVPAAHWVPDGRFGSAYGPANAAHTLNRFFPANQADLDFDPRGEPYTISLWVRTAATGGYNTILGKDNGTSPNNAQYRLWMINSPNFLQAINGNQYSGTFNVSAQPLNNGQWHLVTLVNYLDGSTWRSRIYYNDGSSFSQFITGSGGRQPGLLRIGDTTLGGNSWQGQIDDLRIYRRALTQPEIAALYNPPPLQTYDTWLPALANPPAAHQRGLLDDPDADGLANLLEYALGTHPNNPASHLAPSLTKSATTLSLSYPRLRADLVYQVETSPNLHNWTTTGVLQDSTTPLGQTATATLPITPETEKTFLRLRVTE